MFDIAQQLRHPWHVAQLPKWLWSNTQHFLYRFADEIDGQYSAARWVLAFSVFPDNHGLGLPAQPCPRVRRFESQQWPDSPTHMVRVSLPVGLYQWVAHAWVRGSVADRAMPSDRDLPGCFLNCGSLAVRIAPRAPRAA